MRTPAILIGCLLLAACGDGGDPARLTGGEELYNHYCAPCHRDSGDGSFLKGVPPVRYTALNYRELVSRILGHQRPADSRMPEFTELPKHKAEAIAIYVRRQLKVD